jgi:hypothetical protein
LTVPAVPTGMKTGVSTAPCAVASRPLRAAPSHANSSKPIIHHPVLSRLLREKPGKISDLSAG